MARTVKSKVFAGISGVLLPEAAGVKIYPFLDAPQWGNLNGEDFHSWDNVLDQEV